jgi:hypothetical protein
MLLCYLLWLLQSQSPCHHFIQRLLEISQDYFSLVCNSALELISAHLNIHCERLFKHTMVSIAYAAIVLSAVLSPVVAFQITPRCRNHKLSPGAHGTIHKCLWYSFLVASSCLCWNFAFDRRTQFSLSGLVSTHSACYFCLRSNEIHDTMYTWVTFSSRFKSCQIVDLNL